MSHPDTYLLHALHHNNLALRQHRNFNEADLTAAINVGFFGDSFVENIFMDAPYSFTEPLDFLLNQRGEFNIMNFGVHGYGPGQSFLHYENFHWAKHLDHVFFVYCRNDPAELQANGLFRIDREGGELVQNRPTPSRSVGLINKLHTPYLLLEAGILIHTNIEDPSTNREPHNLGKAKFSVRENMSKYDLKDRMFVFQRLIRKWKNLVETRGGVFHFVTLPDRSAEPDIASVLIEEDIQAIRLYDCFGNYDATYFQRPWGDSPYKFRNDDHWNEAGNRMAAICLYRILEEEAGLPRLSEDELGEMLSRYYSAFDSWIPEEERKQRRRVVSPQMLVSIRERYQAFDELNLFKEGKGESVEAQGEMIISSEYDIYLDGPRLIYVKTDCDPVDLQDLFFLHVTPVDKTDLPQDRALFGFENLDFDPARSNRRASDFVAIFKIGENSCGLKVNLPDYPIRHIRTGQYILSKGPIWQEEFFVDEPSLEHD